MDLQLNIALSTLQMKPEDRPDASVESVANWLREKSKVFKPLDDSILTDVARNCSLQMFPPNHVLIRQGEIGDCFYIILQGQVAVFICTDLEPGKLAGIKEEAPKTDEANKYNFSRRRQAEEAEKAEKEKKEEKLDRTLFGKHIVNLSIGASFGELALINDDCIRNASVITDDNCHFICIDRALYNRSLKGFQKRDFEDRNNFIETHPLFSNWPWRLKRQVAMSLERSSYDFDSLIAKQGKPANTVYFIFRGTARLVYNSATLNATTGGQVPRPSIQYDTGKSGSSLTINGSTMMRQRAGSSAATTSSSLILNGSSISAAQRQVELCSITNGEAVGDLEMLYPIDTYIFTTIAAAPTEVLSLSQKNMSRFLENKTIMKMLVDLLAHAYHRMADRVERNTTCPILTGVFSNLKQIVGYAEAKREIEAQNRLKRLNRKANLASAGGNKSQNRMTAPSSLGPRQLTVVPATNAFRRFLTKEDDSETTLHYSPPHDDPEVENEVDIPAESKETVFPDWETSDERLTALEERIRRFNTEIFTTDSAESAEGSRLPINIMEKGAHLKVPSLEAMSKVAEMRRYTISGQQNAPRPGTLVKVRVSKNNSNEQAANNNGRSPLPISPASLSGSQTPISIVRRHQQGGAGAPPPRNVTFRDVSDSVTLTDDSPSLLLVPQDRPRSFSLSGSQK